MACYREALRLQPGLADAHLNLALAVQSQGQPEEALAGYREALRLQPNFAEAHHNLGVALATMGKLEEATASFQAALRLQPQRAEIHESLGHALLERGRLNEAQARLEEALVLKPDLASAHCNLGSLREHLNDFEAAERLFREALRCSPRYAGAWWKLATLLRGKLPEDDLVAMRELVGNENLPDDQRAALHFGMAEVLDARKNYDQAAEHLRQGNALALGARQKRGLGYDPAIHGAWVDQMLETFSPEFFQRVRGFGVDSQRPIFIVGLPARARR